METVQHLPSVLNGVRGYEDFAAAVGLDEAETQSRRLALEASSMPFRVTGHYAELIRGAQEPDRTRLINIVVPPPVRRRPFRGRFDPYGNRGSASPGHAWLQQKYENTLLLHLDDFCLANCQFCYKVNEIRTERLPSVAFREKIDAALSYLRTRPGIDNVLVTGGDPMAFRRTGDLVEALRLLQMETQLRAVRIATKGLAYDPERFLDEELLGFLREANRGQGCQITVIAQFNHPAELGKTAMKALGALADARVTVRSQPALLRHVNDRPEVLARLFHSMAHAAVVPYYIVTFMPVRGVEQYGMPLHAAYDCVARAKAMMNGLEKKGVLIAPHDWGKLEICGFLPSVRKPEEIVLKWHQVVRPELLPPTLGERIPVAHESLFVLPYRTNMYCVDHVFRENGLPFVASGAETSLR
jgi:lysine 2,3-aminomutase